MNLNQIQNNQNFYDFIGRDGAEHTSAILGTLEATHNGIVSIFSLFLDEDLYLQPLLIDLSVNGMNVDEPDLRKSWLDKIYDVLDMNGDAIKSKLVPMPAPFVENKKVDKTVEMKEIADLIEIAFPELTKSQKFGKFCFALNRKTGDDMLWHFLVATGEVKEQ